MASGPIPDLSQALKAPSGNGHAEASQRAELSGPERAFQAGSSLLSGTMAISASQFMGAPLKLISEEYYNTYMALTKQAFAVLVTTITQWWSPTIVRVSGDSSMKGQLVQLKDGTLKCNFPKRLVLMANHQLYTDWLYLWWIAYTNEMHGHVYIILKESLKNLPIIGWSAQFYNFIFLARDWKKDKSKFQATMQKFNKSKDPMWLLIFPEGTNLAKGTRESSKKWAEKNGITDMKHQLLPRSTGIQCSLQELRQSTQWLYDCTIAYEGVPEGQFGQDIFTLRSSFLEGKPPTSVNMHWRRFRISSIPLDSPKQFEVWLRNRWREKDYLLEHFSKTKRFPADEQWMINKPGKTAAGKPKPPQVAPFIETEVKSGSWEEFLSLFTPITGLMSALFLFYSDPQSMLNPNAASMALQQQGSILGDIAEEGQHMPIQGRSNKTSPDKLELPRIGGSSAQSLTSKRPSSGASTPARRPSVASIPSTLGVNRALNQKAFSEIRGPTSALGGRRASVAQSLPARSTKAASVQGHPASLRKLDTNRTETQNSSVAGRRASNASSQAATKAASTASGPSSKPGAQIRLADGRTITAPAPSSSPSSSSSAAAASPKSGTTIKLSDGRTIAAPAQSSKQDAPAPSTKSGNVLKLADGRTVAGTGQPSKPDAAATPTKSSGTLKLPDGRIIKSPAQSSKPDASTASPKQGTTLKLPDGRTIANTTQATQPAKRQLADERSVTSAPQQKPAQKPAPQKLSTQNQPRPTPTKQTNGVSGNQTKAQSSNASVVSAAKPPKLNQQKKPTPLSAKAGNESSQRARAAPKK